MADDGEVVLAAERDVVLSLRVDPATAELIASVRFLAPRVRDPARDATLLAEQLGRFVRAVAAEAETRTARRNHPSAVAVHDGEVARAALLAAGAERAQIPNLRASSADDEVGAAALLATVAERARFRNLRPAATALLATVAERARFPNLRAAAVLAEDAERARLRNLQLVDAHEDDAAVSGRAHVRAAAAQEDVASVLGRDLRAALVVEVDAHGALRVVVNPSHVEAFDRGTLAVAVVPAARAEGLFRGDLLVASGGAAALFRAAANGVLRRDLLAAPVFVFVEPQVRGAARRHHVMLGAPNIIGADAGGSRSHRGIQVGGDDAHGPQIAVAEDRGFGGPTAVANRGGARGQQRSDRVVFRGSLSAAGARGEEVVFRGRITSLRHGLVVSLFPAMPAPTPLGTSSRAVATSTSRPRAAPKPKPTPATATKANASIVQTSKQRS
ncbi:hypothetical protein PR202_ga22469 [Eleusine coracana subsp. coracana]|uniref:Uncharacterized protein n=1 Tax=Eleusine coracana subsp. coracana TaxID=191504 RepID=A0AAV5D1S7_ELECO|nr:hypothetical protein PR202_ga22469 [Eleusine coracana subsp. coracana]